MSKAIIYSMGLCYASVCAPLNMTGDEVAAEVNAECSASVFASTGKDIDIPKWAVSSDPTFKGGQPKPYAFSVLQEWEGYVVSILHDTFTARLLDITMGSEIEDEEVDFPLEDLKDIDRSRIREGAIFRWIIGYRRGPAGVKDRISRIVFRDLPAWTNAEIEKNVLQAAEWAKAFARE
jgi:hypothetical protein